MMSRENLLHRVRTALGRNVDQPPAPAPPPRIVVPEAGMEERIARMFAAIEALAGKTYRVPGAAGARDTVAAILDGRCALASDSCFLQECGITALPNVRSGVSERAELRELAATLAAGITSADYALADTGTLVPRRRA